jgi:broad specificity phosphatase PhoE
VHLVFLRHGESEWNDVFNRGLGPVRLSLAVTHRPPHAAVCQAFPFRLAAALLRETRLLFAWDSVFLDSPLSRLGRAQAAQLAAFLQQPRHEAHGLSHAEARAHAMVRSATTPGGEGGPASSHGHHASVLATSNLRRACETAQLALAERLRRTKEPLRVLSSLQEISPNVDALSMAARHGPPPETHRAGLPDAGSAAAYAERFECSGNGGNKALRGRGCARLAQFAEWAFTLPPGTGVVATGHSLWFRSFMDRYLPAGCVHASRKKKVANCSLLALQLQRGVDATGRAVFRIPPESVHMLYGGFA